jgi:hypothetical protein
MKNSYEAPRIWVLGDFSALTQSFDKVGASPDFITALIPDLDGTIVPDPIVGGSVAR